MMAEKPILFNTEMVRAILDDKKTQTRRVIKPQPPCVLKKMTEGQHAGKWCLFQDSPMLNPTINSPWGAQFSPQYQPGDILWVRETWQRLFDHRGWRYEYRADHRDDEPLRLGGMYIAWRPSIHMPRDAARLFLRVTTVRVQRLQEITSGEAVAEGIKSKLRSPSEAADVLIAFEELWNRTIKPADLHRYGWSANPWVWVIGFVRVENCAPGAEGG